MTLLRSDVGAWDCSKAPWYADVTVKPTHSQSEGIR